VTDRGQDGSSSPLGASPCQPQAAGSMRRESRPVKSSRGVAKNQRVPSSRAGESPSTVRLAGVQELWHALARRRVTNRIPEASEGREVYEPKITHEPVLRSGPCSSRPARRGLRDRPQGGLNRHRPVQRCRDLRKVRRRLRRAHVRAPLDPRGACCVAVLRDARRRLSPGRRLRPMIMELFAGRR
jgi:hypothetical protein